jgi:hypothetical protein
MNSENNKISNKSVQVICAELKRLGKVEPPTAAILNTTTHATDLLGPEWRALSVTGGCQGD